MTTDEAYVVVDRLIRRLGDLKHDLAEMRYRPQLSDSQKMFCMKSILCFVMKETLATKHLLFEESNPNE